MKLQIINYRPPRIALFLVLVAALLHWLTPFGQLFFYSNLVLGAIIGVGGFGVMMWGWWLFRKSGTAICPTATTNQLITSGIYQLTRNPMYLGLLAMLLALAIIVGSLPFYLVVIAYFIVINNVFCPYEEDKLANAFGKTYIDYKSNVRRWL